LNIIKTTAPISIDLLKSYFVDKTIFYVIDYKNSTLKGKKLLTYLSNLEIPSDIDFTGCTDEEFFEILNEYFSTEMICNINFLEKAAITALKEKTHIVETQFFKKFLDENGEIVESWLQKLYSLTLYNLYSIDNPEFKDFVSQHQMDDTDSLVGINFVSLLKHNETYELYQKLDTSKLKFYKKYFDEYMFKGKNLYYYWANENNPMFLLTFGIADGIVKGEEYVAQLEKTFQELKDASPVQ
jgi:hypothetical protein